MVNNFETNRAPYEAVHERYQRYQNYVSLTNFRGFSGNDCVWRKKANVQCIAHAPSLAGYSAHT